MEHLQVSEHKEQICISSRIHRVRVRFWTEYFFIHSNRLSKVSIHNHLSCHLIASNVLVIISDIIATIVVACVNIVTKEKYHKRLCSSLYNWQVIKIWSWVKFFMNNKETEKSQYNWNVTWYEESHRIRGKSRDERKVTR